MYHMDVMGQIRMSPDFKETPDEQEAVYLKRQIDWIRETRIAVVVSEEPGVPGGAVTLLRACGGGLTAAAEFPARSNRAASRGFGSRIARVHFNASSSATSVRSTSSSVL